jgi:hypothetical protein
MTQTTKIITRYQVRQLQIEAGSAGDTAMVTACRSALASDVWPPTNSIRRGAYDDCAAAIRDAAEITRSLYDEGGCLIDGLDPDVEAAAIQESLTSAQPEGWVRLPDGRRCFAY